MAAQEPVLSPAFRSTLDALEEHIDFIMDLKVRLFAALNPRQDSSVRASSSILTEFNSILARAEACKTDIFLLAELLSQVERHFPLANPTVKKEECDTSDLIMGDSLHNNESEIKIEHPQTEEPITKRESPHSTLVRPKREQSPGQNPSSKRRRVHVKEEPNDSRRNLAAGSSTQISPSPIYQPPKVEYEDIDAEVEGRLRVNEERRQRLMTGETNPSVKRKRNSSSSATGRLSVGREAKLVAESVASGRGRARDTKKAKKVMSPVAGNLSYRIRRGAGRIKAVGSRAETEG